MTLITITNLTKQRNPKISWKKIVEKILGEKHDLSIVLAGNELMKKLNKVYLRKNKPASVLSFPFSRKHGEVFINLHQTKYPPLRLFIHALLHLKGLEHSAKMEEQEGKFLKYYEKNHCRFRCRNTQR